MTKFSGRLSLLSSDSVDIEISMLIHELSTLSPKDTLEEIYRLKKVNNSRYGRLSVTPVLTVPYGTVYLLGRTEALEPIAKIQGDMSVYELIYNLSGELAMYLNREDTQHG